MEPGQGDLSLVLDGSNCSLKHLFLGVFYYFFIVWSLLVVVLFRCFIHLDCFEPKTSPGVFEIIKFSVFFEF